MSSEAPRERLKVRIRGAVQGVGFRPFVFRLATELDLAGWVLNSSSGVSIEAEGPTPRLREFLLRLERDRPPRAVLQGIESSLLDPVGYTGFEIHPSVDGDKSALVLPDIATCPECLAEVRDPGNRRYRYPFTNCTNCGPRFSIILSLPYDRPRTTMAGFEMCPACRAEYEDPRDRRFHAQPNACPACGPRVELWDGQGSPLAARDEALRAAAARLRRGDVIAMKGLGGFQLLADARNACAVERVREAKAREEKPFALMFPSLHAVREECDVSDLEARLLCAPESPIVLLKKLPVGQRLGRGREEFRGSQERNTSLSCRETPPDPVCEAVAPCNPTLGVMLPYTPLHHLLLEDLGFPIVATSGNRADEPICTDEREALDRLRGMADAFLVHDRPIARHVDDSIARIVLDRELLLRRSRGYAPLPITVRGLAGAILGVGPHLKNTVALSVGENVFVSQHIGDLETVESYRAFEAAVVALEGLYAATPVRVACDAHPNYLSTGFAHRSGAPVVEVQHHVAHVLACMAENEIEGAVLGLAWDGTGYGPDGTIWGGEFFLVGDDAIRRVASFRPFPLAGGDQAVKEPRRSALGLLFELGSDGEAGSRPPYSPAPFDRGWQPASPLAPERHARAEPGLSPTPYEQVWGEPTCSPGLRDAFDTRERQLLTRMLTQRVNATSTSSVGRLFDAVAAIAGVRQRVRFEGQAAMELEYAAAAAGMAVQPYPFVVSPVGRESGVRQAGSTSLRWIIDWAPMIAALLSEVGAGVPVPKIAARFHHGLVEAAVRIARLVGERRVVLSGGCFQNRYLTERLVSRLREEGFRPYWHQRIPPNDGGIALGQVVAAGRHRILHF